MPCHRSTKKKKKKKNCEPPVRTAGSTVHLHLNRNRPVIIPLPGRFRPGTVHSRFRPVIKLPVSGRFTPTRRTVGRSTPTYAIGPLHLLEHELVNNQLDQLGSNLWREEPECLDWLNAQASNSVVYVNFGSITVMTPDQLTEFAWGLANSNHPFLWIIRPDLVSGATAVLPPEFLEATRERGLMATWCPQEKVLSHPSVGGFLTHSGWNSTLESICSGVPMICWPFFAEQQTNCWYCCTHWGIGMEIDNNVKRDEVENLVRTLMVGEKGKEMKKRAMEWKNLAGESAKNSSYQNLRKVIDQVLLASGKV